MEKVLVIHGPNLNLLGEREPAVYGRMTLRQINQRIRNFLKAEGAQARVVQFNSEGDIIDCLHRNRRWANGVVINPGAYTHYSIAIRDAIAAIGIPTVEVHLSDISKREGFRKKSVIKAVCFSQVSGLGWKSYIEGSKRLLRKLRR